MIQSEQLELLQAESIAAEQQYEGSKRWLVFCDEHCQELKAVYENQAAKLEQLQSETDAYIHAARRAVGIFSPFAVSEAKHLFMQRLYNGRNLAARATLMGWAVGWGDKIGRAHV